jgi:hypothetical protein
MKDELEGFGTTQPLHKHGNRAEEPLEKSQLVQSMSLSRFRTPLEDESKALSLFQPARWWIILKSIMVK